MKAAKTAPSDVNPNAAITQRDASAALTEAGSTDQAFQNEDDIKTRPDPSSLSPSACLIAAVAIAALGGWLDLATVVVKKRIDPLQLFYLRERHFAWRIPLAAFAILSIPGLIAGFANRLRRGSISARVLASILISWAFFESLLRLPIHAASSAILAIGLGTAIGKPIGRRLKAARKTCLVAAIVAIGGWIAVVAASSWNDFNRRRLHPLRSSETSDSKLPRDVYLIVLDAVRARDLSLNGYDRNTTPELSRWAKRGVVFDRAIASSSWTFPSHTSIFTGYYPHQFDFDWKSALGAGPATLAERYRARGYRTIGIAGNTSYCSWETGLDRGFARYFDYVESPRELVRESSIGNGIASIFDNKDIYSSKWRRFGSRDARGIMSVLFAELDRSGIGVRSKSTANRPPIFAFLNFLDAHEPFVTPKTFTNRFGRPPSSADERELILDYWMLDKSKFTPADIVKLRNAYDDSIASLDREIGSLLDELDRLGALDHAIVAITSDHGESLGEHQLYNHGKSLFMNEIHVPLMIIAPGVVRGGSRVESPVAVRDLAATLWECSIGDLSRASVDTSDNLPGQSLSRFWSDRRAEGERGAIEFEPILSSTSGLDAPAAHFGANVRFRGLMFSLVAENTHYIRDEFGEEALFDLKLDPAEDHDLINASESYNVLTRMRVALDRELKRSRSVAGIEPDRIAKFRSAIAAKLPRSARSTD